MLNVHFQKNLSPERNEDNDRKKTVSLPESRVPSRLVQSVVSIHHRSTATFEEMYYRGTKSKRQKALALKRVRAFLTLGTPEANPSWRHVLSL